MIVSGKKLYKIYIDLTSLDQMQAIGKIVIDETKVDAASVVGEVNFSYSISKLINF